MNKVIPLFPLNLVVFPYSRIPLHIFEEKYKIMVGDCLENKSGFGILSILKERLSKIGSYVKITSVLNKYPNGEMDIVVKGINRFKVIETKKHKDGYLLGTVEEYVDVSKEFDSNLLEELKNNFTSILNKINFKLEDAFWESYKNYKLKSYKIAEKSGLTIEQQQEFLTLQKENERIDYLLNHLEKLERKLKENITTGAIVMGDGYL
jgi:Lon protease-like protein